MYKVKPFESFDLSEVKLPDTMYRMAPLYGTLANKKIGGDYGKLPENQLLDEQTQKLNDLKLLDESKQELQIGIVLQLPFTSSLIDFFCGLKEDFKDELTIQIFKHSSLSISQENDLLMKWYSLNSRTTSQKKATFNLQIILKPTEFNNAILFKSDSNFKIFGEIKILSVLNGLISSSMSIQVNDVYSSVQNLLLAEYLNYLQKCSNTKKVDQVTIKYYQNNLQVKSKVQEFAELIFKKQMIY